MEIEHHPAGSFTLGRFALAVALIAIPCTEIQSSDTSRISPSRLHPTSGNVIQTLPDNPDVGARYLFYLHGRIVEDEGLRPRHARFGYYEYDEILRTFARKGFLVVSERRKKNVDVSDYANKIVGEIGVLLKSGVHPGKITVVGASKGAIIAMLVSSRLKNRKVNYALLGSCNDFVLQKHAIDLHGNILSIYEASDDIGGSCEKFFRKSGGLDRHKELKLSSGKGHGFLYKPFDQWVDPIVEWADNDSP